MTPTTYDTMLKELQAFDEKCKNTTSLSSRLVQWRKRWVKEMERVKLKKKI